MSRTDQPGAGPDPDPPVASDGAPVRFSDHVVPVYSIAKTYTAAAALLALDPEAGLRRYLSHAVVPGALGELRVADVLAHRSGLNDYGGWADYVAAVVTREDAWPTERVLARAEVGAPGAFAYSNIGYLLIRLALEAVDGSEFFEVLRERVLDPLGVPAHPFDARADWDACAHPAIEHDLRAYDPAWVYTGTFATTPADAARGIARLVRGELGEDLAQRMRHPRPVHAPGHPLHPAGYGLGLMTSGDPARLVGHGGGGPGFTLFALSTHDGAAWHGTAAAGGALLTDLAQDCVMALTR
ncbi:serine hydrolase domain-containing protein [Serinibacter salmoneus]|uniref:Beta-lactamase n=1 Tax=Serinibacter salmoneus TaxID=556530 RepID=A0A2A9CZP0_9MICO|nr:serine hydrolase domain-containing protein [Serinibacter salmoneus]PFG19918.1 beta-lactamase [Serinibacter salmoneus]